MKLNTAITVYLCYLVMLFPGCARFSTTQTDTSYEEGKPVRTITTRVKANTFFEAKSSLASFAASQTDKTQSAKVGSLSSESNSTNAVKALQHLEGIVKALPK